jgi:hypothetical protein
MYRQQYDPLGDGAIAEERVDEKKKNYRDENWRSIYATWSAML